MAYVVDTTTFQAEGAVLHWPTIARRLGMLDVTTRSLPAVLQLRWTLHPKVGFPTEPFIVWRRHRKMKQPKPIKAEIMNSFIFGAGSVVDLKGTYSQVTLNVSGSAGVAYAFVGSPWVNNIVAMTAITAGTGVQVTLTAPAIEGLVVSSGISINSIVGVRTDDLSEAAGWEKFEIVGVPVKHSEWAGQGIGRHGDEQGMVVALTNAMAAAGQRLERGAPPIGWAAQITAGLPAPTWSAPSPGPLLAELGETLLEDFRPIAGLAPNAQAGTTIPKLLPPPENSSGDKMTGPGSTAQIAPLKMLYMAAGTDCFNALGLGFGTAYPIKAQAIREEAALDYDYMVTARFEKGIDGSSAPVEYAAPVPTPALAIGTPAPASMAQEQIGVLRPQARDSEWQGSVRVSWDRPIPIPLFRPRSFAFARAGVAPASAATLLMGKRVGGAPLPIAINHHVTPDDPEPHRLSAVERQVPIPNDPGTRTLKYAAAQQDIYGQWSAWTSIDSTIAQPVPDDVRIVSAEFKFKNVPVPPATKCPADLVLEFLWDWRVRSPLAINFRGRLYAASYRGAPPPDTSLPSGLQTSLASAPATTFTLRFDITTSAGAPTSSWPGYNPNVHCIALNPAGDAQVGFGNPQGTGSRRYRVTISGFELDYASAGHVGLALWAQGQEAIVPARVGGWSDEPSMIAVSDPRPPLIVPDIVSLSSLPDAAGESHAVLKWGGSPGADGYFIYETTETKLLTAVGEPEPDPDDTLSVRLTKLRQVFDAAPALRRSDFTRRNSKLIKGTSADVTLPRGSTAIHLYVVLGVSAGQVEAEWPTSSTALYAFAVPRVPKPGVPTVEVQRKLDTTVTPAVFRSQVRIATRVGPRVRRIDLHRTRVDDAAKELDTMGPPVLTLDTSTPGWTVASTADSRGTHIVTALGVDTPAGSWKRVWYRAAAWTDADLLRGTLPARSPASTSAWVVIPPSTPPDLSALTMAWSGTAPPDVLLKWTSAAPVPKTALGAHTISIRARRVGAPVSETPLLQFDGALSELLTAQPATGAGAWREGTSKPAQYRAIVRRAALTDAVDVSVRITDPLGRVSESLAQIEPGHILPDPVITSPKLVAITTPPGAQLGWKSTTPIDPGLYTLRVTVARPPRRVGLMVIPQPAVSLQLALSDVPLDEPGPVPPGTDPLRLRRMPGAGPDHAYYAFVRVPFTRITVRITSPDGRVVEHVQLPE